MGREASHAPRFTFRRGTKNKSFTEKGCFIFCDLYPKAADFLPSATAGNAPSVTFQGTGGSAVFIQIVKEPVLRLLQEQ